jgi:hypothetical protein
VGLTVITRILTAFPDAGQFGATAPGQGGFIPGIRFGPAIASANALPTGSRCRLRNGLGVAALVIGVASLVAVISFVLFPLALLGRIVGLILGIIALTATELTGRLGPVNLGAGQYNQYVVSPIPAAETACFPGRQARLPGYAATGAKSGWLPGRRSA